MLKHLAAEQSRTYVSMDNTMARALAKSDPILFFQTYKPPMIIEIEVLGVQRDNLSLPEYKAVMREVEELEQQAVVLDKRNEALEQQNEQELIEKEKHWQQEL